MRSVKVGKKQPVSLRVLVCWLLFCSAGTQAAIYQWQEPDGTTVYSQLPPQDGRAVREVDLPPPPGTTPEQAQQELQRMQEDFRMRIDTRERKAEERARQKSRQETRDRNCQAARKNLARIQDRARFLVDDGAGGRTRMTEAEKQQLIRQYEADARKFCRQE